MKKLPTNQTKKLASDPDWTSINPGIIELANRNSLIRQPIELYLTGHLTWLETLETIVLTIGKEFKAQQDLLIETQNRSPLPPSTLQLNYKLKRNVSPQPLLTYGENTVHPNNRSGTTHTPDAKSPVL